MNYLGIALIFSALLVTAAQPFSRLKNYRLSFPILVFVFVGFAMALWDRIIYFSGPLGFSLQTAVGKAQEDAQSIADLKIRVEQQSATVDMVADKAKSAQSIASLAKDQLAHIQKTLQDLESATAQAKSVLKGIRKDAQFGNLILDASDDNRVAVDNLLKIAVDKSDSRSQRATESWLNIITTAFSALQLYYPASWGAGVEASKLNIDQLRQAYFSQPLPLGRIAIAQYIVGRKDVPQDDKRKLFLEIAKTETSLKNEVYAYRYIAPEVSIDTIHLKIIPSLEDLK